MHQHQHRPKLNEYRKAYKRRRIEQIMEQAEKRARDAPKRVPRRPRTPRDQQDW